METTKLLCSKNEHETLKNQTKPKQIKTNAIVNYDKRHLEVGTILYHIYKDKTS